MDIWSVTYFVLQDGCTYQKYFYSKKDADNFSSINGQCATHPVLLKIEGDSQKILETLKGD